MNDHEETGLLSVRDRYSEDEIAQYDAEGLWRPESLYDEVVAQARVRPYKTYIFDSSTSLTFVELRKDALRIAVGLHRRGIRRGDRVVV